MSIARKNRLHNSEYSVKGLLYSQRIDPINQMRFGIKPMWYNGCGIIAVYNALILLNRPDTIQNIADYYERKGRWIFGLWGIKPWKIKGFLQQKGFRVESCDYRREKSGTYIMYVWNKGGGAHFMAVRKFKGGRVEVYNGYRRRNGCDVYNGFNQFFDETCITCLFLYKIIDDKKVNENSSVKRPEE